MKKIFMALSLALLMITSANAQVIKKGDAAVNLGLGLPPVAGNLYLPAIITAFDLGITEKLGIGYLSVGAQASISGGKLKSLGLVEKTTNFIVGPRAAYHFDFAGMTGKSAFDKLDIYAGVFTGLNFRSTKWNYESASSIDRSENRTIFWADGFAGIRYSITENFRLYAEVGGTVSYLSGGISFVF